MRQTKYWVWAVGVAGCLALAATAHAGGIAVESVAGERTKAADSVLQEIFNELAQRGYRSGYAEVGKAFETSGSRPSIVGAGLAVDFAARVERGYRFWITGKFPECLTALRPLVEDARKNPSSVISTKEVGQALFKAQVGIAMCQHRLGDDNAAWATMAELVRSFDLEVTKGQYGVEASTLYQQVRKEAKATRPGSLTVRSADSSAVIYVNERFARVGEVSRLDMIPGVYRVVAQLGQDKVGRTYDLEIKSGGKVELVVDPAFESAVVTSEAWTGLSFRDRAVREQREGEVAARLGSALGELGAIVVGIDTRSERTVVYGALFNVSTGKEIRHASVVIDTLPPPGRLRALVRFLAGEPTSMDGVEVHKVVRKPSSVAGAIAFDAPTRPLFTTRRKIAAGVGVVGLGAVAAGVVMTFQAQDLDDRARKLCPRPTDPCVDSASASDLNDRAVTRSYLSLGAYGLGVAALGVATYLWLSDSPETNTDTRATLSPHLSTSFSGLSITGSF
jgi:hypothetical protein